MRKLPFKRETKVNEMNTTDFAPIRIVEIELGQPLLPVTSFNEKTGQHYRHALCLVRLHTQPLGMVELELDESEMSVHTLAEHIWYTLHTKINEHLGEDGLPEITGLDERGLPSIILPRCLQERERLLTNPPFVSVIVPTHDRPERIQACLHSLLSLDYPRYEIIIVDNAPSTTATADFIQRTYHDMPQVHYLREDHPSVSRARNCGMMKATGEILAFVDDDVVVDTSWLTEIVRAFSVADNVMCVTGLILPLELETSAQFWLEQYYGYSWSSRWFTLRIFDKNDAHPYKAGLFGAGANMAFKAAFLRSIGGFDPTIGAPCQVSGEDNEAFHQVVSRGYKLVYEPGALVYHLHRRDYTSLQKQIYHYGVGFTGRLMRSILNNPLFLLDIVPKLPYFLFRFIRARSSKGSNPWIYYPKELRTAELKGFLYGPFAYLQSRWTMRGTRKDIIKSEISSVALPMTKKTPMPHCGTQEHKQSRG